MTEQRASRRSVWRSGVVDDPRPDGFTLLMAGGDRVRVRLDPPGGEPTKRVGEAAALLEGSAADGASVEVYGPLERSFDARAAGPREAATQTHTMQAELVAAGSDAREALLGALAGRDKPPRPDVLGMLIAIGGLLAMAGYLVARWGHHHSPAPPLALLALLVFLARPTPLVPLFVRRDRVDLGLGVVDLLLLFIDRSRLALVATLGALAIGMAPTILDLPLDLPASLLLAACWCGGGLALIVARYAKCAKQAARLARDEGAGSWFGLVASDGPEAAVILHARFREDSVVVQGDDEVTVDLAGKTVILERRELGWSALVPTRNLTDSPDPTAPSARYHGGLLPVRGFRLSSDDGVLLAGKLELLGDGRHRLAASGEGPPLAYGFPLSVDGRALLSRALFHYRVNVALLAAGGVGCFGAAIWAAIGAGWFG